MKLCGSAYSTDNPNATFYANPNTRRMAVDMEML